MTTACWGTNSSFDCAWVGFGYGSCYDMIGSDYHRGWWISLDALKVLAKYDYPYGPAHIITKGNVAGLLEHNWHNKEAFIEKTLRGYLIREKYHDLFEDLENEYFVEGGVVPEKFKRFPLDVQHMMSPIHISHPDAAEWFREARDSSGWFIRNNPDYKEPVLDWQGNFSHHSIIPSMKALREISFADWQIIDRIETMNKMAKGCEPPRHYDFPRATIEDLEAI